MDKCESMQQYAMTFVAPLLLCFIYAIVMFLITIKRDLDEIVNGEEVSPQPLQPSPPSILQRVTATNGQRRHHYHHHHYNNNRHRHRDIYNMYVSWVNSLRPICLRDCSSDLAEWRKLTPEMHNDIARLLHGLVAWECNVNAVSTISSDKLRFLVQKHLHTKSIQRGVIRSYCNAMRFDGRQATTSQTPTTATVDPTVMMLTIAQYLHFVSSITILAIITTKFKLNALWSICERIGRVDSLYIELLVSGSKTTTTTNLLPTTVIGHVERAVKNQLDYFAKIALVEDIVRQEDILLFLKFTADKVLERLNYQRYYNVDNNPFEASFKTNSFIMFDKENIYMYDKKILCCEDDNDNDDDDDEQDQEF